MGSLKKNRIKKIISFLSAVLFFHFVSAQNGQKKYWIQLKDKNGSPFSINNPDTYLSKGAIARRSRQHIPISSSDLPVNPTYINQIKAAGAAFINQSKWFNAITVSASDTNAINAVKALPFVKSVQKLEEPLNKNVSSKFEFESTTAIAVNPERSPSPLPQTGLNYGISFSQANQIGADCLHNLGYQGQGMTIAVLDAGFFNANILPAFDSMFINHQLLGTRDFVTGDTLVFEDYPHGMNVLSCMAGNLPGRIVGTAPKAKYWLLRTENANSETISEEYNWLRGAEFADSVGVDVINSSLGYNYFDTASYNHTYADMNGHTTVISKAAEWAARKGILVVSSAGNSAGPPWYKITAPADADSILTVGAVDSNGVIASFSSRGLTFDGRIKPNVAARGLQAVIAANAGDIAMENGTSFSSPISAGAAACLWQANPSATVIELINAIQQSATQASTPDSIKGYGIPNFCAAHTILTGIESKQPADNKFNVYPDPFNDNFNVTFYSEKKQTIVLELYDMEGRKIRAEERKSDAGSLSTFNISDMDILPNGLYLIRLTANGSSLYKKLVKNKY